MNKNNFLNRAKRDKKDEFYTQYEDIEKEMVYYRDHFKDKTVFCNCNDGLKSNFYRYFRDNFTNLGLKKLICTTFGENPVKIELEENRKLIQEIESGDFRDTLELLDEADIVVTNPPFSLFREYVKLLMDKNKKFIILGNLNTIYTKEIFPYLVEDRLWLGLSVRSGEVFFTVPDGYESDENGIARVTSCRWITNVEHGVEPKKLELVKTYNPVDYPKYDTFNAINVNRSKDIPVDYDGLMGVPITYLDKHRKGDFEIVGILTHGKDHQYDFAKPIIDGVEKYKRLVIKNKHL